MSKTNNLVIVLLVGIVFFSGLLVSGNEGITGHATSVLKQNSHVIPSKGHAVVSIPAHAAQLAPTIFSLGTATHKGRVVQGYAIVHYKKGYAKPSSSCGNGICEVGENSRKCPSDCGGTTDSICYELFAKEANWKTQEPWVLNPANNRGLTGLTVFNNFAADIEKWEAAAGKDIIGQGTMTSDMLTADMESPDGKNEVYFGSISEPGAIAITILWGVFGGPPKFRELIEWDHIYDQTDFDWSLAGEPGKMDFENIATHELGHTVGLADLYTTECSEVTMYGYASEGETNKRTLEAGDITGVRTLYK